MIKMSMTQWAEQECRIACKKENPDFNFDSDDFDYGCSCYKSALKAYKSLMDDGHSGSSFSFTRSILKRLMDGRPLTPITDEDFFLNESNDDSLWSDDWLKERGIKSQIQCPRMSSLFREEYLDGRVSYHDINRTYCVDIEDVSSTYHSGTGSKIVDEMFPITMPYMPGEGKYVVYEQTFLVDKANGDFDTKGIIYMETPEGKRIDINRYFTEKDGKFEEISKGDYDVLLARRSDKMYIKVADNLLFTLISNSASEKEIDRREMRWKSLLPETRNGIKEHLQKLCHFFEKEENYKYNTFHYHQLLCSDNFDEIKDVPELVEIGNYLRDILKVLA